MRASQKQRRLPDRPFHGDALWLMPAIQWNYDRDRMISKQILTNTTAPFQYMRYLFCYRFLRMRMLHRHSLTQLCRRSSLGIYAYMSAQKAHLKVRPRYVLDPRSSIMRSCVQRGSDENHFRIPLLDWCGSSTNIVWRET